MANISTYIRPNGYVLLSVTYRGKRFQVATGLTTTQKFSGKEFPATETNYKVKTSRLMRIYLDCEEYILRHTDESVEQMKTSLKRIVTGKGIEEEKETFIEEPLVEYIKAFADTKEESTGDIYRRTAKRVSDYDPLITFSDVNKKWLDNYSTHQIKTRHRALNGVAIDLRNIRAVFNWAIDNELTTNYPFRKFSIKTERTRHLCLPAEQIRLLRDYEVEPYQEVYRDIFMLGFYLIGINISDLLELKSSDYRFGRITYSRNKTHRLYDIKVEPEAEAIINKYRGTKHLLRFLDDGCRARTFNYNCNAALKRIGKMEITKNKRGASIKKNIEPLFPDITWYTARRSWATIAAQLDIPKETIGKALGHSEWDNSTTDLYIQFDYKKIDKANRKVIDFIFSKKQNRKNK